MAVIVRPLMLVLWVFILWGSLYGAALTHAIVVDGPAALGRAISGEDPLSGVVSLAAAGLAALVWSSIAAAVLMSRVEKSRDRAKGQ